jgi:hypothetical protein
MPKLIKFSNRIQTLIHHINTGAVKVDVLPNMFAHLGKLNELGGETTDGVQVNDQLARLFTNTIASFINPTLRNINLMSDLVSSLQS